MRCRMSSSLSFRAISFHDTDKVGEIFFIRGARSALRARHFSGRAREEDGLISTNVGFLEKPMEGRLPFACIVCAARALQRKEERKGIIEVKMKRKRERRSPEAVIPGSPRRQRAACSHARNPALEQARSVAPCGQKNVAERRMLFTGTQTLLSCSPRALPYACACGDRAEVSIHP